MSIAVHDITLNEVKSAIKSLKGILTAGHDQLPAFLFKDCSFQLAPFIHRFLNLIIENASFPNVWKLSKITPIFKSGSKSEITNYRTIALLSNFSKIFEIVINRRLHSKLEHVISDTQHGFMPGRSTNTNLIQICQYISSEIDKKRQVDVIYTNLSKAFDSICHAQLINKLDCLGFEAQLLKLINSYLLNRSFYVICNGFSSKTYPCPSGVPQGSILGPLLFLLYINDLLLSLSCPALAYADDKKLFSTIYDISDCLALQKSLDKINSWCKCNRFVFNVNKCKFVNFTRCHREIKFTYTIDFTPLTPPKIWGNIR